MCTLATVVPLFDALHDRLWSPSQALMIGDDLINDVGGAQNCGMRGLQVRTGKYRSVSVCMFVCLSVCLQVCWSVCLYVCMCCVVVQCGVGTH